MNIWKRCACWLTALLMLVPGMVVAASIAAGGDAHGCALSVDGQLKCWGANSKGQTGSYTARAPVDVYGSHPGEYSAVVTADEYTCAVTQEGAARCWGSGTDGRLGDGSGSTTGTPVDVIGLGSGVEDISARNGHACVLVQGGGVKCWGVNSSGQLGDGTTIARNSPVDVVGLQSGATGIATGAAHTCAAMAYGGVRCWGSNQYGVLGDGTTVDRLEPQDVPGLTGVVAIAAGDVHTCALMASGGVKCWGNGDLGRLGDGTSNNHLTPNDVAGLASPVTDLRLGATHSCALLQSGHLACWGGNSDGQMGDGTSIDRFVPQLVAGLAGRVVDFDAGRWRSCARTDSGALFCWGRSPLGSGDTAPSLVPSSVAGFPSAVAHIDGWARCGVVDFSRVYCWGGGTRAPVDLGFFPGGIRKLSTGASRDRFCVADLGGAVWCWGEGPVGDGGYGESEIPVRVAGLPADVIDVVSGIGHHCALSSAGEVFCWGYNWGGQIGDGTEESRFVPVRVSDLAGVVQISSKSHSTCALLLDGALKCWGVNLYGQLGDGTTSNRSSPVDVLGMGSDVASVSVSEMHACAGMHGGGVKCWGNNLRGQLGDGSFIERLTPVNVQGIAGAVAVSAGDAHGCAVTAGGAVKCWGYAGYGQLGTGAGGGTTPDQPLPVDVLGLSSGIASVSCGFRSTCALTEDGRALCWGDAAIDTPSSFADYDSGERYGPIAVPTWPRHLEWLFRDGFDL